MTTTDTQDTFETDILIVGAGPAGLSCAIRLKQLHPDYHICLLEKASTIGGQCLSGAVLDPKALNELLPDWRSLDPPVMIPAKQEKFLFLTPRHSFQLPFLGPLNNHGNYIIRLSIFCQWLAKIAENLGIEIYTGFAGAKLVYNDTENSIIGIKTDDKGLDKESRPTDRFQPGMVIKAKHIILAEGVRGSLSQEVITQFNLNKNKDPQTYGLGVKEIWEINSTKHDLGRIIHTLGYPLDNTTYGGGFLYHIDQHQVAVGFVVGLDYQNPTLDPFQELQRFKTHPEIGRVLQNGKRIQYGAKSLVEGGLQSLPENYFPGGLIIGDSAGFLNVAKLKGVHTAMKSGMLAAEAIVDNNTPHYFSHYLKPSWLYTELYQTRNIRRYFKKGLWTGLLLSGIDHYLFQGKTPWTLHSTKPDHLASPRDSDNPLPAIIYPKPDNQLTFDKPSSLLLSNIHHDDHQPCHLKLKKTSSPEVILKSYSFCPASVYEVHEKKLFIHAQNCLHCKACDIKDSTQNIQWTCPEGGSGPDFSGM